MKKRIAGLLCGISAICLLIPCSTSAVDMTSIEQTNTLREGALIKEDGSLWIWGFGEFGLWGDGNGTAVPYQLFDVPVKVMDDVESISGKAMIRKDGSLWTWGSNHWGEVGNGTVNDGVFSFESVVIDGEEMVVASTAFVSPFMVMENVASVC